MVLVVAALIVLTSGTAMAVTYTASKRASLKLNKPNYVATALTKLASNAVGPALTLETDSTDPSATPLKLDTETGSQAPMSVDSSTKVTNLNADQLDGNSSEDFAASSHTHSAGDITGDGEGSGLDADTLDGKNSTAFASAYKSTVVVSPVGTATQNGTALKNALASITNASQTNPYLLKIEPGVYDLGAAPGLEMKSWVDIEGSGEGITTLTSTGSQSFQTGTVVGAPNSEMRLLTVRNTGGSSYATAVYYSTAGPLRLTHMTAAASGGTDGSLGARISAGTVTLNQMTADASGNSQQNLGVFVGGGMATLIQATASASGGTENFGFAKNVDNDTEIRESRIVGSTNTVRNFGGAGAIRVGGSQLSGGGQAEATTCAGVYDENYTFFASSCP